MLEKLVEELLYYAELNLDLDNNDKVFIRNTLLHELNLLEPYTGEIDKEYIKGLSTPKALLDQLDNFGIDNLSFFKERIMSIITPNPSVVINKFNNLLTKSSEKATSYFYNLMIKNNYIKKDDIDKNILFERKFNSNRLEITINLSKPEKNNKDIIKEKDMISSTYPKCLLCLENLGFYGGGKTPGRSNIRIIPIKLGNENWFIQYSPYAYYTEHMIAISNNHTEMIVDKSSLKKELDFVDLIPNYFIGSNSDLPIVGGSMLSHHHFQGGKHTMPMMESRDRYKLKSNKFIDIKISYLDWFNNCIKLESKDRLQLLNCATYIIDTFKNYDDSEVDLISSDDEGRHSTATTITRKIKDTYIMYIILRNNRCNKYYPEGIFHAHKEYHNIKKEGIGLIEAMGLFILPGRLKDELALIENILSDNYLPITEHIRNNPELNKHINLINDLVNKYQRKNTKEQAQEYIKDEVAQICANILKNTAIFKDTIDSQIRLMEFFKKLNFEVIK